MHKIAITLVGILAIATVIIGSRFVLSVNTASEWPDRQARVFVSKLAAKGTQEIIIDWAERNATPYTFSDFSSLDKEGFPWELFEINSDRVAMADIRVIVSKDGSWQNLMFGFSRVGFLLTREDYVYVYPESLLIAKGRKFAVYLHDE